jgi:hypothetical protein
MQSSFKCVNPVRTDLISVYLSLEWQRVSTDTKCGRDIPVSLVKRVQYKKALDGVLPCYASCSLVPQLQVFSGAPGPLVQGPWLSCMRCCAKPRRHSPPKSLWVSAFALPQPGFYRTVPRGDVVESEARGRVVWRHPEPRHWHIGLPCTKQG